MELLEKLRQLKQDSPYPMHMPGHKRVRLPFPDIYDIDITEIQGYDNLHDPTGIIKELSEETAQMYRADEAYLSVGGSTDMILTAVFASTRPGQKILMARNCHKSVYHAAILRNADTVYTFPKILDYGIPGQIEPYDVEKLLDENKDTAAVVITSPTYEGVISDVRTIADICHQHNVPLIVDAAHGAHLGFGSFLENPINQGADAVIVSLHKTLPSLTQTACLLRNRGSLISHDRIRKYFDYFETSSPSYVLMAGIDNCVTWIYKNGQQAFKDYSERLSDLRQKISEIPGIILFSPDTYDYDKSKIVIHMSGKSGTDLAEILRTGGIEPEMASLSYVICMTSVMDTQEGFDRLLSVLRNAAEGITSVDENNSLVQQYSVAPVKKDTIGIAETLESEYVDFAEATDMECGSIITVYPPGIPLIVPGEVYTDEIIKSIEADIDNGLYVEGIQGNRLPVIG